MRLTCIILAAITSGLFAADGDLHVLPQAAGSGDGSSWANAQAAQGDNLSAAIATLPPGATLRLGSGTYPGLSLSIQAAGTPGNPVTILGEDTGSGLPALVGSWKRSDPSHGPVAVSLKPGCHDLVIAKLAIRNYQEGVSIKAGGVREVRFADLTMTEMRSGFEFTGGTGAADKPESWNEKLVVERCSVVNYTKRGIRFRRGNRDIQVLDCLADGGGKDWAVELWQTSFGMEGDRNAAKENRERLPDHDIRFERCIAKGNYHDKGDGYWNADGFCAEASNYGMVYIDCTASENTDGGWDDKSPGIKLVRCNSFDNKRNYRFWSSETVQMKECISGPAHKRGGNGDAASIWTKGRIEALHCTFSAQPKVLSVDGPDAHVTFTGCTFVAGPNGGSMWAKEYASQVVEKDCIRKGELSTPSEPAAAPAAPDAEEAK
jgi:hypothetical protein